MPPTDKTRALVLAGQPAKSTDLNNLRGNSEGTAQGSPSRTPRPCTPQQGHCQTVPFWNSSPEDAQSGDLCLEALLNILVESNGLAKGLKHLDRSKAYHIKTLAMAALIRAGVAHVNGVVSGDLVGIDVEVTAGARRARVHMPLSQLPPDVRTTVRRQRGSVSAKTSLRNLLNAKTGNPIELMGRSRS